MRKNLAVKLCIIGVLLILISCNKTRPPYDIDNDGYIGESDLKLITESFGDTCIGCPEDVNNDSLINSTDFRIVVGYFGKKTEDIETYNND
ncbi:MAG: hypothetical protein JXA77_02120 [Bacteroidales bacterium]|nr:hypothetical protein [Bacteroidales bacterium]MBN2820051.1 hypothetical protein [Bacteroidales bacterium]